MGVFDLGRLLLVLSEERVEFIIVNGWLLPFRRTGTHPGLDILYRIEHGNVERLERAFLVNEPRPSAAATRTSLWARSTQRNTGCIPRYR